MTPASATLSMLTPPPPPTRSPIATPNPSPPAVAIKLGRVCLPCRLAKRGCHIADAPTSSRASCSACAARAAKLRKLAANIKEEESPVDTVVSAPAPRRRVAANLPSSAEIEICRVEMSSVLLYHLVHCSADAPWGYTKVGAAFLVAEQLEKVGFRSARLSPEAELRLACLVATGARRTRHSAIVGSAGANPALLSVDNAGKEREAACQHFANRAMVCARACGIFANGKLPNGVGDGTRLLDSIELLDFLKGVVHRCSPGNPAMKTIILRLHNVRIQILRDPGISEEIKGFCREHDVMTIPAYDAFHVLGGGTTDFLFSDFELKEHYGWSPARAGGARAHLEYLTPRAWDTAEMDPDAIVDLFYDVFLFGMRSIYLIRRNVIYLNTGMAQTIQIFDSLYNFLN